MQLSLARVFLLLIHKAIHRLKGYCTMEQWKNEKLEGIEFTENLNGDANTNGLKEKQYSMLRVILPVDRRPCICIEIDH